MFEPRLLPERLYVICSESKGYELADPDLERITLFTDTAFWTYSAGVVTPVISLIGDDMFTFVVQDTGLITLKLG